MTNGRFHDVCDANVLLDDNLSVRYDVRDDYCDVHFLFYDVHFHASYVCKRVDEVHRVYECIVMNEQFHDACDAIVLRDDDYSDDFDVRVYRGDVHCFRDDGHLRAFYVCKLIGEVRHAYECTAMNERLHCVRDDFHFRRDVSCLPVDVHEIDGVLQYGYDDALLDHVHVHVFEYKPVGEARRYDGYTVMNEQLRDAHDFLEKRGVEIPYGDIVGARDDHGAHE